MFILTLFYIIIKDLYIDACLWLGISFNDRCKYSSVNITRKIYYFPIYFKKDRKLRVKEEWITIKFYLQLNKC